MQSRRRSILSRRAVVGAVAGLPAAVVLTIGLGSWPLGISLGFAFGLAYGLAFRSTEGTVFDHALAAAALGVSAWVLVHVTALPLVRGGRPAWLPDQIRTLLPGLAMWVVAGGAAGVVVPPVAYAIEYWLGPVSAEPTPDTETRIVIVGGGFAGLAAAQRLEELFGPARTVELTLVSETNAILFTPMLAEVAAGSLAPSDITSPLRTSLRQTGIVRAAATDIDFDAKRVFVDDGHSTGPGAGDPESETPTLPIDDDETGVDATGNAEADTAAGRVAADTAAQRVDFAVNADATPDERARGSDSTSVDVTADPEPDASDATDTVPYDHLVLAVGSETNYFGMEGVRAFAFDFTTLGDAMALRNHVIACFERADRVDESAEQRALLTFVVAGAGFAGAELAGALNDLVHELLVYYPNVPAEAVRVVVVHSGDRIMPSLSESLSAYALDRISERGVAFRLDTRVEEADPTAGTVSLSTGEDLRTETLVWTAGVRPSPLIERLDVPTDKTGAVRADATFAVPERDGVWAVGDCAAATDPETGDRYPATAQYATRAGNHLAENVYATVTGGEMSPMTYRTQGTLAVIGHQTACAEVRGRQFSGLFAWLLWRAVYLAKLPGTEGKIRVFVSWLVEIFFPRDIVQTLDIEIQTVLRDE